MYMVFMKSHINENAAADTDNVHEHYEITSPQVTHIGELGDSIGLDGHVAMFQLLLDLGHALGNVLVLCREGDGYSECDTPLNSWV